MLDIQYKSSEIEAASTPDGRMFLTADISKPVTLFQAQSMKVSTGVAIKSDQLVFAVPTIENNHMGLIPGSGVELLDTSEGAPVELFMWNRNVPGQQRSIDITPGMIIAELVVMPRYNLEKKPEAPAKTDNGAGKTGAAKSPATVASISKKPEDMKIPELQAALDNAKVAYKKDAKKGELIDLVHGAYTAGAA